ncbi:MAG: cobalt-precorrin-6A reductase [Gemmatimonadaceae bacterium]|nr:cobalt-precorrin-6A reductase [Gloeobacterales cyanobacterium ES-bin-141]
MIWLIGGTSQSSWVADRLSTNGWPWFATVVTEAARRLYAPAARVLVSRLTRETLPDLLRCERVRVVLDCSHPFAVEISRLAIDVCRELTIPYVRFERAACTHTENVLLPDIDALMAREWLMGERVLLATGSKDLWRWRDQHHRRAVFARVLPSVQSIAAASQAGFTQDRIIALRPPFSLELERALWQHWQIETVVTRASGSAGGEEIKSLLARELGVRLIVLERPLVSYPAVSEQWQVVEDFCRQALVVTSI